MNGPFFSERPMLALPLHDELSVALVFACLVTQRGLTRRGHRVISLHASFPGAVWMIDWVHHHAADCWTNSHVSHAPRFADRDVFMIEIADLADRGHAIDVNQPL